MNGSHDVDGGLGEDARAFELATVEHGLVEQIQVGRGGIETAFGERIAGVFPELHGAFAEGIGRVLEGLAILEDVGGRHAVVGGFGGIDEGVLHAERMEDAGLEIFFKRHAGDDFDDAGKGGDAGVGILPAGSGIEFEWRLRVDEDDIGKGSVERAVEFLDGFRGIEDHAGSVGHQIADGDEARGLAGGDGRVGILLGNAEAAKFGKVILDGIRKGEFALLHELHGGDGDHGFGHGVNLEDSVGAEGLFCFDVGVAGGIEGGDLAVAGDEGDDTGHRAAIDKGLHANGDLGKAGGIETGLGGVFDDGRLGAEQGGGEEKKEAHDGTYSIAVAEHSYFHVNFAILEPMLRIWGLGIVACLPAALWGQVIAGSVVGTLVDSSGAAVGGVALRLISETTGATRAAISEADGRFGFPSVATGVYVLAAEHPGFKTHRRGSVTVTASEAVSVGTIVLEVGDVNQTVTVESAGATVQTASGERSGIITASEIESLTVINRDFASLVSLMPGVVDNPGAETQGFSGNTTFNVLGSRTTGNNISIDGASVENTNGAGVNTYISMDAVQTVKIQVSNFQAEFGRKPGAGIQAVTKSGTKQFHGAMYYYKRHEMLNATSFFNNRQGIKDPPYRYTTAGFNIGGPLYVPGWFNRDKRKLFFFLSTEYQQESRPQAIRQMTVPTGAERVGDFRESRDVNGALIPLLDPENKRAQFPGNVIPASRINDKGQAYLNLLPEANFFNLALSGRRYNYQTQESLYIPKHTELGRVDYVATGKTTLYGRFLNWWENIQGWAVPAGNSNWGWLPNTYNDYSKSGVISLTQILGRDMILESSLTVSRWIESGPARSQADLDRLSREKSGVTIPQFHPENNPYHLVPQATFGGITGAVSTAYADRFPLRGAETVFSEYTNVTMVRGKHTGKAGFTLERWREIKGERSNFTGTLKFDRDTNNPNDANDAFANALLGNFDQYTESTSRPPLYGYTTSVEWFAQDNWRATRRLTLDVGLRFGWSQPFHSNRRDEAGFLPWLWNPAAQVTLIAPVRVNGARVAENPNTGEILPAALIGAIAPGGGDPFNGTLSKYSDPNYPQGLRGNSGVKAAPRLGFAYDPRGKGRTAIRGGVGMFYEVRDKDAFAYGFNLNPPLRQDPILYYGNIDSFSATPGYNFPSGSSSPDPNRIVARVVNYSIGIQQAVGRGTVADVAYVGALGRHLMQQRNLNAIPLGTDFQPWAMDPSNPGRPLPAAFLRPYVGYNDLLYYTNDGNSSYHSLQAQVRRQFAKRVQFTAAWTWSKAMDYTDSETGRISTVVDPRVWNYGKAGFDRTHVLKTSFIVDFPKVSRYWKRAIARVALDDWQLSGIGTMVSGAPLGISYSIQNGTTDITGSPTDGARVVVVANPVLPKGERTFSRNINTEAFRAPAVGSVGNAPKDVIRGPGINNFDLSLFKNVKLPGDRWRMQVRGEAYNAFNHTQFSGLDTAATFDGRTGAQINQRFGEFTAARANRRMQVAVRLTF